MEYFDYGDLSVYIEENKHDAMEKADQIATQLLEGLVVLHERGICHRDLKPQVGSHDSPHSQLRYFADRSD